MGSLRTIYANEKNKGEADLVAVYGIHDASERDPENSWLLQLFSEVKPRVLCYDWSDVESRVRALCRQGIREHATKLLDSLADARGHHLQCKEPIMFLGLDIGGIIIKEAVNQAAFLGGKYKDIFSSVTALVFSSCPHDCDDRSTAGAYLQELLQLPVLFPSLGPGDLAAAADGIADVVIDINRDFIDTKIYLRAAIVDVVSESESTGQKLLKRTASTLGVPYSICQQRIETLISPSEYFESFPLEEALVGRIQHSMPDGATALRQAMLSQATPQHPLPRIDSSLAESIIAQVAGPYKSLQRWATEETVDMVWIKDSGQVFRTGQALFSSLSGAPLSPENSGVFYYELNSLSPRDATSESIISTFIAGILNCRPFLVSDGWGKLPAWHLKERSQWLWSRADLVRLLNDVLACIDSIIEDNDKKLKPCIVLANLDCQIDSHMRLLEDIASVMGDLPLKLVVISRELPTTALSRKLAGESDQEGETAFPHFRCLDKDAPDSTIEANVEDNDSHSHKPEAISLEPLHLIQRSPRFYPHAEKLQNLLSRCNQDLSLRRMLIKFLQHKELLHGPLDLEDEISALSPPTPKRVFRRALLSVPTTSIPAVHEILQLLTHSFREIQIPELKDLVNTQLLGPVASFTSGRSSEDLGELITTWFGPLIHVDGNRIVFGHPLLRRFLIHNSDTQKPNEKGQRWAHERIARLCIAYGYSTQGRAAMLMCVDSVVPCTGLRRDFASYALKYLPVHLEMTGTSWGEIMSHVQPEELPLLLWSKAHWIRLSPAAEPPVSSLALFARYGASDMLERTIEALKGLRYLRRECLLGLESAAGSSVPEAQSLAVVEKLLTILAEGQDSSFSENENLHFAILAALEHGNLMIAEKLVERALADEGIFKPINEQRDEILHCAALRGALDVVKLLLEAMSQNEIMDVATQDGRTVVHSACVGNHVDVVKLLIEKGHQLEFTVDPDCPYTPLEIACLYNNTAVVSYMVERALPTPKADQSNDDELDGSLEDVEDAIEWAIRRGQPRILEILTNAMEKQAGKLEPYSLVFKAVEQGRVSCLRQTLALLKSTKGKELRSLASEVRVALERLDVPVLQVLLDEAEISPDEADFKTFFAFLNNNWTETCEERQIDITRRLCDKARQALSEEVYDRVVNGAFWNAAERSDLSKEQLSCLIQNGADANAKKLEGYDSNKTPIYHAAYYGRAKHVEYLLSCGADPNIPCTDRQWTAAHAAYDSAAVLRELIRYEKLDLNAKDSEGGTILYYAAKWNEVEVVKELLGARVELEHCSVESGTEKTALSMALENGRSAVVALLIQAGAFVTKQELEDNSQLSLHQCVSNNDGETLKALLLLNVDVTAVNDDGGTALHCIDSETNVLLLRLLVNRGTPLDNTNHWEQTSLCVAVMEENLKAAEFLISRGAQLNIKAGQRGGPLHRACRYASLSMVKLLCEKDADVNLADPSTAGTPLQAACWRSEKTEIKDFFSYLLETQSANVNQPSNWWGGALFPASLNCPLDAVQVLLDHEADVQASDKVSRQPIHFALYNSKEHVELLCKYGSVLTSKDVQDRTALHCAVLSGRPDVVQCVLDKHSEQLQARDVDGWTPLMWSVRPCTSWHWTRDDRSHISPVIRTLLSHHDSAHASAQKLSIATGSIDNESSSGLETKWTALKLAKLYNLEQEVIDLLTPTEDEIAQSDEVTRTFWASINEADDNAAAHFQGGMTSGGFCDSCLVDLIGRCYTCMDCLLYGYSLCFKCYNNREKLHNADHASNFKATTWNGLGLDFTDAATDSEPDQSDDDQQSGYLRDEDTDEDVEEAEAIVEEQDGSGGEEEEG